MTFRLRIEAPDRYSLVQQMAGLPLVDAIVLEVDEPLTSASLELTMEPAPMRPIVVALEAVAADAPKRVDSHVLGLDPAALEFGPESASLELTARVEAVTETGQSRTTSATRPIELVSRDHWVGEIAAPELLAAFVLPGDAAVAPPAGEPTLVHLREQIEALRSTNTIGAIELAPAEVSGPAWSAGRLRSPSRLVEEGDASPLEIALAGAAALEARGAHVLLVFFDGAVCLGAWDGIDRFELPTVVEFASMTSRVDAGRIALFDVSALAGDEVDFDEACERARERFLACEQFEIAIDVAAARVHGIAPREATRDTFGSEPDESKATRSRLDSWKQRLLDLSLRNRLLNFRPTKKSLRVVDVDVAELEDALASERSFVFRERALVEESPESEIEREEQLERRREDARAKLGRGQLLAEESREEIDRRLVHIYREAKRSLAESGANTIYLALGFLLWFEDEQSEKPRYAPLILLPIDLVRRSVHRGVSMRLVDEDSHINSTLLEKLRIDFGIEVSGLEELPEDDAGLDVRTILERFRKAIAAKPRWKIVDEAWLAPFSFTKFLMWRDLDARSEAIVRHPVLRRLVEKDAQVDLTDVTGDDVDIDGVAPPLAETFVPMLADSSQLRAIRAAAAGLSFVLEGPPGTGKSQTIGNLVAHALASGKRVLFVAEKTAALEVVKRRLVKVGLGDFCLELHSDKAKKREVLAQLESSLDAERSSEPSDWGDTAARLEDCRNQLDAYRRVLHEQRPVGVTLFEGLARAAVESPVDDFDLDDLHLALPENLTSWTEAVRTLENAARALVPLAEHGLRHLDTGAWSPEIDREFRTRAAALPAVQQRCERAWTAVAEQLGLAADVLANANADALGRILRVGSELCLQVAPTAALLERSDNVRSLAPLVDAAETQERAQDSLNSRFDATLLQADLSQLLPQLRRAAASWWPLSWWRGRKPRAVLVSHAKGKLGKLTENVTDVEEALRVREAGELLAARESEAEERLGMAWSRSDRAYDAMRATLTWADPLVESVESMRHDGIELAAWRDLATAVGADRDRFEAAVRELEAAESGFVDAVHDLESSVSLDATFLRDAHGAGALARRATFASELARDAACLRDRVSYVRARTQVRDLGLDPIVHALETHRVVEMDVSREFSHAIWRSWSHAVIQSEPALRDFHRSEQVSLLERFRELDESWMRLSRAVVRARLTARLPRAAASLIPGSELSLLRRELKKRRRHLPIRQLFVGLPTLLPRLKPCMLMSPISVAQYFDSASEPDTEPPFDLVVFDEASQIPTWDAIGAIARGKSVIVVGDSKQLPPTMFFSRDLAGATDDAEAVEELESVLDECSVAGLPRLDLRWHYRSQHEGLIAFSNVHYYEGRLQSFPSARHHSPDLGVSWEHVPGVYDRSATATNRAEAERIVDEIRQRVSSGDTRSIGVVTFSQAQQTLIEDLLDEARRADSVLDEALLREDDEEVFVKNLENVQGDERDVILFSVAYGPDENGKVWLNFGPLNKVGGERRLNVAITRARQQVVVFSTLRADQIDPTRISSAAIGVRHLRAFLDYAERGDGALAGLQKLDPVRGMSRFGTELESAIEAAGWVVERGLGCSRYRIDLAVRDRTDEGRFLLGVEWDGPSWAAATSARDRERLRELVMKRLGWNLERIWSPEWTFARDAEIQRIVARIAELQEHAPRPKPKVESPVAPAAAQPASELAPSPVASPLQPPEESIAAPEERDGDTAQRSAYHRATLESVAGLDIHEPEASSVLAEQFRAVLDIEAPIERDLLCRRVLEAWGIGRFTKKIEERLLSILTELAPTTTTPATTESDARVFVWGPRDPSQYRLWRTPASDDDGREARDLPIEEIANAGESVLRDAFSLDVEDFVRELARRFGFARMGSQIESAMLAGIDRLVTSGRCKRDGSRLLLP